MRISEVAALALATRLLEEHGAPRDHAVLQARVLVTAEAGVPPGVVNVLTTSTPWPVTAAMLADPRVRKLSFTGSTGSAARFWRKRRKMSSPAPWNSAATRRSSCSTMRTSTRRSRA